MSFQSRKVVKFNNGHNYPILGLGTRQTTADLKESDQTEIYNAVKSAIDIGYRHFDCAASHNNQKSIGRAITEKIEEGVIRRRDIFVTSKLWNNKHNPREVKNALKSILEDLGLDYLNLFLIHWPVATKDFRGSNGELLDSGDSFLDTWRAMEICVQSGLTLSIGVSNFDFRQVEDILKIATIKPVVNQVENHPYLTEELLKDICQHHGILLAAYGPLGSPYKGHKPILLDEPQVKKLAVTYNKTPAQILIKFQIQRGIMVVPKSTNPIRQKENFDVWDFEMTKDEMECLEKLNKDLRYGGFPEAKHLKGYPFTQCWNRWPWCKSLTVPSGRVVNPNLPFKKLIAVVLATRTNDDKSHESLSV